MEDNELSFDQSMSVVKASELFPAKKNCENDAPDLELPFKPIHGEFPEYVGLAEEGLVALSNLRLFIKTQTATVNIPLGLIDSVEVRDIFFLLILCKDARTIRLTFSTNELCQLWHRRLFHLTALPKKKEDIFAYWFHAYCSEEAKDSLHAILSTPDHVYVPDPKPTSRDGVTRQYPNPTPSVHFTSYKEMLEYEIKRMGFDMGGPWKISNVNADYSMCSTYPPYLLIPGSINDDLLRKVAGYRSYGRVPNVVWRHSGNGAVIARCSQPQVGILGWRNNEDEDLIKALGDACAYDPGPHPTPMPRSRHSSSLATCPEELPDFGNAVDEDDPDLRSKSNGNGDYSEDEDDQEVSKLKIRRRLTISSSSESEFSASIPVQFVESCDNHSSPSSLKDLTGESRNRRVPRVLIVDARSFSAAMANRGRGGGYECPEYYPNCDIQYMNLANIHTIRKSFQALRHLCYSSSQDPASWLSWLETCKWMTHLSALLKSAVGIVRTVASEGRPVVIHCSDGWDRTPQLVALAEIIMDPFYRRMDGFQVLIEREWLAFGHKFGDRCGQGCGPGSNAHDQNERCPVFSQWLDCIYQLMHQFPTAFQFNSDYLITVLQHVYSNVFGTFLFNSLQERQQNRVAEQTYSLWSYLQPAHGSRFVNPLYCPSEHQTLYPSWNVRDFVVWPVYHPGRDNPPPSFPLSVALSPSTAATPSTLSARSKEQRKTPQQNINGSPKSESSEGDELDGVDAAVAEAARLVASFSSVDRSTPTGARPEEYTYLAEAVDDDVGDAVDGRAECVSPAIAAVETLPSSPKLDEKCSPRTSLIRGQCPLCFLRREGEAPDDSVLDVIDFVSRSKTDPEHRREQGFRTVVARFYEEIADLQRDLHETRLQLYRVNKCVHCKPPGYDSLDWVQKMDAEKLGPAEKPDNTDSKGKDFCLVDSPANSWQVVSENGNGVSDFDYEDEEEAEAVEPPRPLISNGAVLVSSPGCCRASSEPQKSRSGSFRNRRPSSDNKGAKMVQPVHT